MKYLRMYEDLIRDLNSLGISEHRCKIQIYKEFKIGLNNIGMKEEVKMYHVILPELTSEKTITKNTILRELKAGRYELTIDKDIFKIPGIGEMQKDNLYSTLNAKWNKAIKNPIHDTLRKVLSGIVQFPSRPVWETKMVINVDDEPLVTY